MLRQSEISVTRMEEILGVNGDRIMNSLDDAGAQMDREREAINIKDAEQWILENYSRCPNLHIIIDDFYATFQI